MYQINFTWCSFSSIIFYSCEKSGLNGQKLSAQSNNAMFWHLRPGNWTLEARVGQMHQQINFQVEVGNIQPTRQGFSVAHPTISPHSEN
jgi:penicillin-binding protein 1C